MTNSSTLRLSLILILAIFFGCKKYEEGPMFSLKSKKERVSGKWQVAKLTADGKNELESVSLKTTVCNLGYPLFYAETTGISGYVIEFSKSGNWDESYSVTNLTVNDTATYHNCYPVFITEVLPFSNGGTWEFGPGKESLKMVHASTKETLSWNITELREKSLKASFLWKSKTYKIELLPV